MQKQHTVRFIDAAKRLYENIGISIESDLIVQQTSNLDNAFFESIAFEYDTEGRVSVLKFDRDNDGESDTTQSFTYDQNGRIETIYNSTDETTQSLTYDDNNKLLRLPTYQSCLVSQAMNQYQKMSDELSFQ